MPQAVVREAVRAMPPEARIKCGSALLTRSSRIRRSFCAARKRLSVIAGNISPGELTDHVFACRRFGCVRRCRNAVWKSGSDAGRRGTYFAVAASFFTHVNLVENSVGEDFTEKDASIFHGRRVTPRDSSGLSGKTFFWAGRTTKT